MRGLDRYIGRTVLTSVLLVLAILVGLDALTSFIDEVDDIVGDYTFPRVALYIFLTVPSRVYEYMPFAALIGCLIGLGQLAASSELVVMRSAGVSVSRLVWITMKPILLLAAFGFLIGEYLAPRTAQIAQSQRAIAQSSEEVFVSRFGVWNREGNTYLHFNAVQPNGVVFGVTMLQFDDKQRLQSALRARRATYQGGHWIMERVVKTNFSSWETTRTRYTTLRWDTGISPELLTLVVVEPEELPITDLYRYSRYLHQQGLNADDYNLALWKKLLQPLTICGLVLVAISFVFGPLRDGTMGFRIFSGVIVGVCFRISQDMLGPASLVFGFAPLYAAMLPIAICVLVGLLLLTRAR
ncbi:MAG: LPS export ABC transporter permease LptG [Halieaceae bacterium]|nr:LPS export ABC transporter permease LptG [Halieaceae bacterium]